MNVNVYYGGRGRIDDPTLTVIGKIQDVLEELRVKVTRYNLYEYKNTIPTLPQTLVEADAIILASTVEWFGVGGYMQLFLDACWEFGDKERISQIYMMPVVISRTYGEREAKLDLDIAWEILGGKPCSGICGYIQNAVELELNPNYVELVEKKSENLYRTVSQKIAYLPASNKIIKQKVAFPRVENLSPEESAQLSQYVTDDNYVQTQKQDIQELTSIYRDQIGKSGDSSSEEYIGEIKNAFKAEAGVAGSYMIKIEGADKDLVIRVSAAGMTCEYGSLEKPDVEMETTKAVMNDIIAGRMTFQRAFMSGSMKMKGDFRILCALDQVLHF